VSVAGLSTSPSESLRAIAALHWTLVYAPAGAHEDTDRLGSELAADPSPDVRRGLAGNLAIVAARSGLSGAGENAARTLSGDPYFDIRQAARKALNAPTTTARRRRNKPTASARGAATCHSAVWASLNRGLSRLQYPALHHQHRVTNGTDGNNQNPRISPNPCSVAATRVMALDGTDQLVMALET
jgi:hypothetical protein